MTNIKKIIIVLHIYFIFINTVNIIIVLSVNHYSQNQYSVASNIGILHCNNGTLLKHIEIAIFNKNKADLYTKPLL